MHIYRASILGDGNTRERFREPPAAIRQSCYLTKRLPSRRLFCVLCALLRLFQLPSPHQNDRSVLEADFVDGPGTAKFVSPGQDHVDRRFSLGFEAL
jgi:hypothetical protein